MADEIQLKGGYRTADPRLDRLPQFDERSRNFPIGAVVPKPIRTRSWDCSTWLDQGQEGACVGFAWHHEAAASPIPVRGISNELARDHYFEMQRIDEWEGGAYPGASPFYEGTSVLAGAKVMQGLGYFGEYRWAFSIDEVLRAISHEGPVVFGIPWLDSMYDPRPNGLLDCSGATVGGHAILGRGLALQKRFKGERGSHEVVRLRNSWGRNWGLNGDAYVRIGDLERLLNDQGDCCVPVARRRPT